MGIGDWGLGFGEFWWVRFWCSVLGFWPYSQLPIPKSPIPNPHGFHFYFYKFLILFNKF